MTAQANPTARASPELRMAPLSPRFHRIYTTAWDTANVGLFSFWFKGV
jgi:hypothetical protein